MIDIIDIVNVFLDTNIELNGLDRKELLRLTMEYEEDEKRKNGYGMLIYRDKIKSLCHDYLPELIKIFDDNSTSSPSSSTEEATDISKFKKT